MHQLLISDESRLDILDAYSWYEGRKEGLGKDFELCLEAGLSHIQQEQLLFQKRYKNIHIHFIKRFPYGIHYLIEKDAVKVFGVFHMSRSPGNWATRLKP